MATDGKLTDLGQDGDDPAFASRKRSAPGRAMAVAAKQAAYSGARKLGLMEAAETRRPAHRSPSPRVAIDHLWRAGRPVTAVATKSTEEIIAAGTSAGVEVSARQRPKRTGEIVLLPGLRATGPK